MINNNLPPKDIIEHFGKLRLCQTMIYSLYVSLKDKKPESAVLCVVSREMVEAIDDIYGFIDRLLNPSDYAE